MMSLFGKKKKEADGTCQCSGMTERNEVFQDTMCCGEKAEGICCIKVLGSGCKSCHTLYENAKEAAERAGVGAEVEYVTDLQRVMEYGVMSMPALVINEQVVSMGKVLKSAEIEKLIRQR